MQRDASAGSAIFNRLLGFHHADENQRRAVTNVSTSLQGIAGVRELMMIREHLKLL